MSAAYAHGLADAAGESFGWSFEPWAILPMLVVALLYGRGSREIAQRGNADRRVYQWLFWSGLATLALALMSPLHEYGEHLFSAHMVEHELLMVVGVPLIVASPPGAALLWGMPPGLRAWTIIFIQNRGMRNAWAAVTDLGSATVLHAAVLWLWHLPLLFEAAVAHEGMHILQHLSFIVSAIFFWSAVLDRDRRRTGQGIAALALFFTSLQASLLGALLTFTTRNWYPHTPDPFPICGLSRGEDQSLAGLVMWIPACTIYVVAALVILARWLGRMEVQHG